MNILCVSRWRPHRPDGGAALRNAQNLAALGAIGRVDVLSAGRREEVEPVPGIGLWRHVALPEAPLQIPGAWLVQRSVPMIRRHALPAAASALRQMLAATRYDLAVVEEIALAGHIPALRAAGVPVVFDAHNVEARLRAEIGAGARPGDGWSAALRRRLEERRLAAAEGRAVRGAALVWACSEVDSDAIRALYRPAAPVAVVPNTVDVDAYAGARAGQRAPAAPGAPPNLLFIGTLSYPPNEAAALELIAAVLPVLRARGAEPRLTLVGRDPTARLAARAAADPAVVLTGAVPSVLPYLSQPALMALPIRTGSGTRLKILEAFAAGCAVVSTAKGAEGIAAMDGREIRLAEDADAFADAALALWRDPATRLAQADAACRLVEERYSWRAAGAAICASIAAAGLGGGRR